MRFARQLYFFPSKDKETEVQKAELTYPRLKYRKLRLKLKSLDPSLILFPIYYTAPEFRRIILGQIECGCL